MSEYEATWSWPWYEEYRKRRAVVPDNDPLSLDDTLALMAALRDVQRITDMGVEPVRVWRLTAECPWHGKVEEEATLPLSQTPSTAMTLTCNLCKLAHRTADGQSHSYLHVASTVVLVRG